MPRSSAARANCGGLRGVPSVLGEAEPLLDESNSSSERGVNWSVVTAVVVEVSSVDRGGTVVLLRGASVLSLEPLSVVGVEGIVESEEGCAFWLDFEKSISGSAAIDEDLLPGVLAAF